MKHNSAHRLLALFATGIFLTGFAAEKDDALFRLGRNADGAAVNLCNPEDVLVMSPSAKWVKTESGADALDIDPSPGKIPVRMKQVNEKIANLTMGSFTIEMRIFFRARDLHPEWGPKKLPYYYIVSTRSVWTNGFNIGIMNRDLGLSLMKGIRWQSVNSRGLNLTKKTNCWLNLAFVYDSREKYIAVYLDGKRMNVIKADLAGSRSSSPMNIGGYKNHHFDGLIESLVITPRAKSAEELSGAAGEIAAGQKKLEAL